MEKEVLNYIFKCEVYRMLELAKRPLTTKEIQVLLSQKRNIEVTTQKVTAYLRRLNEQNLIMRIVEDKKISYSAVVKPRDFKVKQRAKVKNFPSRGKFYLGDLCRMRENYLGFIVVDYKDQIQYFTKQEFEYHFILVEGV